MRDKIRVRPAVVDRPLVNTAKLICRHPECENTAVRMLNHVDNGFSYGIVHCKDHKAWAEELAPGFEKVIHD